MCICDILNFFFYSPIFGRWNVETEKFYEQLKYMLFLEHKNNSLYIICDKNVKNISLHSFAYTITIVCYGDFQTTIILFTRNASSHKTDWNLFNPALPCRIYRCVKSLINALEGDWLPSRNAVFAIVVYGLCIINNVNEKISLSG